MTIFKGYLLLLKRNLGVGMIYLFIFIGLTIALQAATSSGKADTSYENVSLRIAAFDNDNSVLSEGLTNYLKNKHKVVKPEVYDKDKLLNKLYYDTLDYIVVIPEGFSKECKEGTGQVDVTKSINNMVGMYGDMDISSFVRELYILSEGGFSENEAVEIATENCAIKSNVKLTSASSNVGEDPSFYITFRYVPYLYLGVLCFIIGNVMLSFSKKDISKRLKCGAVTTLNNSLQAVAAFAIFVLGLYIFSIIFTLACGGTELIHSPNLGLFMLNMAMSLLTSFGLAFLIGTVVKSDNALSGLSNVVVLGLSFLGGVFVPMEIMGNSMRPFAKFLPTYWYEASNDILIWNENFFTATETIKKSLYIGLAVQLAMAIVFVIATFVVRKVKRQAANT